VNILAMNPADQDAELERRARLICGVLHGGRHRPDLLVTRGDLERIGPAGCVVFPPMISTTPLWTLYLPVAQTLLDDEIRRAEKELRPAEGGFE
jgi:hypothetical protein